MRTRIFEAGWLSVACLLIVAMPALAKDPDTGWSLARLKARGATVFRVNCVACHQADGQGIPGVFPALVRSPVVLGPKAEHIRTVLNGRRGTGMLPFGARLSLRANGLSTGPIANPQGRINP